MSLIHENFKKNILKHETKCYAFLKFLLISVALSGCSSLPQESGDFSTNDSVFVDDSAPAAIEELFKQEHPQYADSLFINVRQQVENYIRGEVVFVAGFPGGLFLAAKINDRWQIVHEGNGQIPCTLAEYGFPAEMLFDCAE
jgi:hypothetical protein